MLYVIKNEKGEYVSANTDYWTKDITEARFFSLVTAEAHIDIGIYPPRPLEIYEVTFMEKKID